MTDLEKHVNQPGRDKLVKQVRAKINELGVEYIFFQFISVTGRVVGKGIPTDHWERTCEKGFQLVYGATANLFVDRHKNYIGYGPEAKELVGIPDPETFCQLPWDKKVARVYVTCFRNREERENPNTPNSEAILWTSSKMFWPILYTVLTTICAFLSLIFSGIKPIIDFGWMMTVGLLVSLSITFTLLPAILNILSKENTSYRDEEKSIITSFLSEVAQKNTKTIFASAVIVVGISIFGITKLEVENSFINYFDKKTEIYKGMKLIDDELGGTTPLDVIVKFPGQEKVEKTDDDFDGWDDEDKDDAKYWFTRNKIDRITQVHDYLDNLDSVGKVISFASMVRVVEDLSGGKKLQGLEMGVLYTKIPNSIKKEIIDPYISIKNDEARISLRILDSKEDLRRNELIKKINYDLENKLGLERDEFKLAGILILFNNLLQSLFKSQILTLGVVMTGITLMFLILFRNITLSLIGVVPNFMAAFLILGIIGLLGIPLDMMTITIAAITIGIAVDNSIHYIYRFKEEFKKIKNYNKTLEKCHATVGVAILNTSITIVFGFSILVLSNFIPTIYFGIFTGMAMLLAMISVLTLLPKLILVVKPFGNV